MADVTVTGTPGVVTPQTDPAPEGPSPLAGILARFAAWFDLKQYPAGTVRGILVSAIVFCAIAGYWHGAQWQLPQVLETLLSAAWGFLMAQDSKSSLKAWLVIAMVLNVLALVLWFNWAPPVLATLAVQGLSQYVTQRVNGSANNP